MNKEKIGKLCTVMSKKDLDGLKKLQKKLEKEEDAETGAMITIVFKEKVSFEKRQEIINKLYLDNEKEIKGMSYSELKDMETYNELKKLINDWEKSKRKISKTEKKAMTKC